MNEQESQQKDMKIFIKSHLYIDNNTQANQAYPPNICQKIINHHENIVLPSSTSIKLELKRKIIEKPYHIVKIKRKRNKKTQQIISTIVQSSIVKIGYQTQEFADFVSSQGILNPQNDPYQVDKKDTIDLVKNELQDRIQSRFQNKQIQNKQFLWQYIRPQYFLKKFNAVPPKCDFFTNRIKQEQQKQLGSCSIGYQDPIPLLNHQPPQSIKEPCWLKNVLLFALKQDGYWGRFGLNQLKNVLKYLCYTFRNGPWKHVFCAFGYDPRRIQKSVIYQTVSLKLKKKQAEDYQNNKQQDLYDPTLTDISIRCIRSYQLCDLAIEGVQQILRGKLIGGQSSCGRQYGWFSQVQYTQIMKVLKIHKELKYHE